jgi:thiol-disulfide isomerase/thioredoxin
MIKRRALAAALPSLVAGILLVTAPGPAPAGEAPPLAGEFVDNFTLLNPPVPAPLEAFQDLVGGPVRLADFAGQVVLLNFWATWCAPCVREMPSLDRLQAKLRGDGLAVVAVSVDRGGAEVVRPFAAKLNLTQMGLYLDAKSTLANAFGINGLPTTFVIDAESRIVGALQGAAEWDTPAALALVRYYLSERSRSDKQSAASE